MMNWPAAMLRIKANQLIASDRLARGDAAGAYRLDEWNRGFVRCCEIICNKPAGYWQVAP